MGGFVYLDDLRRELYFGDRHEFKFTTTEPRVRRALLRLITRHDVMIRSLVVDKLQLAQANMSSTESLYNHLLQLFLRHDDRRLDHCKQILDERQKGKKGKQSLATYLRRELNRGGEGVTRISDIRYHESHRDNLLQAVDMVTCAIYTKFTRQNDEYLRIIQSKMDDLRLFAPHQTQ